jgi:hypothetical protein
MSLYLESLLSILPEAIQLNLDNWSYIQQVDYEKIPFKCKACHEYGHFAKTFPQAKETQDQDPKQDQWQQPKRKKLMGKITRILHKDREKNLQIREKDRQALHTKGNQVITNMLGFQ